MVSSVHTHKPTAYSRAGRAETTQAKQAYKHIPEKRKSNTAQENRFTYKTSRQRPCLHAEQYGHCLWGAEQIQIVIRPVFYFLGNDVKSENG